LLGREDFFKYFDEEIDVTTQKGMEPVSKYSIFASRELLSMASFSHKEDF